MSDSKLLVYFMRRDLRVSDNPIFHSLSTEKDHGFTHLLPLYIFPAQQVEISGFIEGGEKSPYPEARSQVGGFWRCGPHRAKFLGESVWDVKQGLEKVGSGLCIRAGMVGDVIGQLLKETKGIEVGAVWMTSEEGVEEKREEREVKQACEEAGVKSKFWVDEKYLLDDRDTKLKDAQDLPDVFTTYRKMMEPLRESPRAVLSSPSKGSLPPFPTEVPAQSTPYSIPNTLEGILSGLQKPLDNDPLVKDPPAYPEGAESAHPYIGGETNGQVRLDHLLASGTMTTYKETRNGMLGTDFSSKLSAYLAIGCITSRQIHASMLGFEDGTMENFKGAPGYGKGQNSGTEAMRFELLWRDYMRLCTRKYGSKLFQLSGFKQRDDANTKWSSPNNVNVNGHTKEQVEETIERFLNGTTGMGLIDASQREIFHTGYTSNRARQNVASFLAKHLYIDWRYGAEWYESMLVDYDLSSNWGNWQYVSGVGNDPRDDARIFNPVKQSFDYDPKAEYVKTWVPETRDLEPANAFQLWTVPGAERDGRGLKGLAMVERPLKKIEFTVGKRGGNTGRGRGGGGNRRAGGGQGRGGYAGRGYGSTRGHLRGYHNGYQNGYQNGYHNGRGNGNYGKEARTGFMDKERLAGMEEQQV